MTPPPDRRRGIGASEVPAILGQSPWRTPVGVWMDKVGLSAGHADTGPQAVGRGLEVAVLRLAAGVRGEPLTHNKVTFRHPHYPEVPLFATPDGFTRRRGSLVEVKVVGHRWADWTGGPPAYVESQVQAQLACYPRARACLVVALQGSELRVHEVVRDSAYIDGLEADVREFWNTYVVPEIAPPAETDGDRWAVARIIARRSPARTSRPATPEEEDVAGQLADLMAQAAIASSEGDKARLWLAERAAGQDVTGEGWTGSWGSRRTTDWKALAAVRDIPEAVISEYTAVTPTFTFRRSRGTTTPSD